MKIHHSSPLLSLNLLLQIRLNTPLPRFPLIMLLLRLLLLRRIPRQPRNSTTHRTTKPITNSLSEIVDLARSFLLLALLVLLDALLLEALGAGEATDRFLRGTHILVP